MIFELLDAIVCDYLSEVVASAGLRVVIRRRCRKNDLNLYLKHGMRRNMIDRQCKDGKPSWIDSQGRPVSPRLVLSVLFVVFVLLFCLLCLLGLLCSFGLFAPS